MSEVIRLTCQIHSIRTDKGGGKLTLEFGADAITAAKELMGLQALGEFNLALAIVPFKEVPPDAHLSVDETGRIEL